MESRSATVTPKTGSNFLILQRIQITLLFVVVFIFVFLAVRVKISYSPVDYVPVSRKCGPSVVQFSEDLEESTLEENGSRTDRAGLVYPPEAQWSRQNSTKGCPCLFRTCVTKCCSSHQRFASTTNLTCVSDNSTESYDFEELLSLNNSETSNILHDLQVNKSDFFIFPRQNCDKNKGRFGSSDKVLEVEIVLQKDGTIFTGDSMYIDLDGYCMDSVIGTEGILTVHCVENELMDGVRLYIISCGTLLSVTALLITIAVYAYLPQLQNLHGKLVMWYLTSLVMFYVNFFITGVVEQGVVVNTAQYLMQFSILACFTWLTSMSYEIWSVFSRPLRHKSLPKEMQQRKLLLYSVFSWGCPIILCAFMVLVGVVPRESDSCERPRFQDDPCFFNLQRTRTLFSTLPLMLLIMLNVVMFFSTLINMRCLHFKQAEKFATANSQRHADSQREGASLYLKLFLVMGANWFITFAYKMNYSFLKVVVVFLESAQGVVLLVVLICNKRVFGFVHQYWQDTRNKKPVSVSSNTSTSAKTLETSL